jgi:hypothetical protein
MGLTGHKDVKTIMKYVKVTEAVAHNKLMKAWGDASGQVKVG